MRSRIPDMNDKQLEKMVFLERCLHCLHVVGERIEVRGLGGGFRQRQSSFVSTRRVQALTFLEIVAV